MANKVKLIRTQLGWSQKRLAVEVGTSQQQIQRIESGAVAARLEFATKICAALGKPLDTVFPGATRALIKMRQEMESSKLLPGPDELSPLRKIGIEGDAKNWFFKILLRGHQKPMIFNVATEEKERLFSSVQGEGKTNSSMSFVVFDTIDSRILLNLSETIFCHFLFEMYSTNSDDINTKEDIKVFFNGNDRPVNFGVEPDEGSPEDEEDEGQFRGIFFTAELDPQTYERFHFEDEDGESVFLRAGDIALLQVPLWVVEPELLDELDAD